VTAATDQPRPHAAIAAAVLLGAGVPVGAALVLSVRRPDLFESVRSRESGTWLIAGVSLLCLAATAIYLVAALAPFRTRAPRRVLAVAGFLLCSLPALLAIAFGPLAVAFMYGAAG